MTVPARRTLSPHAKCSIKSLNAVDALLKENVTLRETCETAKTQLASSNEAFVKANAKYKEVKEKCALQQTCRELIELVEKLQGEAKTDADSSETDPVDEKNERTGDSGPFLKQEPELDTNPPSPTQAVATTKIKFGPVPPKAATAFTCAKELRTYAEKSPEIRR
ncbi:hypothetical protein C8R47DRAFT_1329336 [Mycena vitilis]|nr:hypothetical protein C8R47DRAFT_1329336 [Mycena vitilis]